MKVNLSLVKLQQGEQGTVVSIQAGRGLIQRLGAMGIRPGARLRKISGSFLQGPVTVQVGNARMALGFGMASKVIIEVE